MKRADNNEALQLTATQPTLYSSFSQHFFHLSFACRLFSFSLSLFLPFDFFCISHQLPFTNIHKFIDILDIFSVLMAIAAPGAGSGC